MNEIQKTLEQLLNKLINKNEITDKDKNFIMVKHPIPPRIYALPKLHKTQRLENGNMKIPFRPISSNQDTPLNN
jgi:hypothetical protein